MKDIIFPFALSVVRYFVAAYGGSHIVRDGLEDKIAGAVTVLACIVVSGIERWWNNRKSKKS